MLHGENKIDKTTIMHTKSTYNSEGQIANYMKSFAAHLKGDVSKEEMIRMISELSAEEKATIMSDDEIAKHMDEFGNISHETPEPQTEQAIEIEQKKDHGPETTQNTIQPAAPGA
jgi:hypothetical protein